MNSKYEVKDRLQQALHIKNITAKELSTKTGIPKSSISQYMSGYAKPKDDRISLMADSLNVNEAWLRGYDVPMNKDTNTFSYGEELEKILQKVSYELNTPIDVIKTIFLNIQLEHSKALNYSNIFEEIINYSSKINNTSINKRIFNNEELGLKYLLQHKNYNLQLENGKYFLTHPNGFIELDEKTVNDLIDKVSDYADLLLRKIISES